eukprot:4541476-Prymnesium_polylepis.1
MHPIFDVYLPSPPDKPLNGEAAIHQRYTGDATIQRCSDTTRYRVSDVSPPLWASRGLSRPLVASCGRSR